MSLNEKTIIEQFLRPKILTKQALNLKDDCALLNVTKTTKNLKVAISTDSCIEGIHMPLNVDGVCAANRAIGCALSDLAAMGARPTGMTIALQLSAKQDEQWLGDFVKTLHKWQKKTGLYLLGGDIVQSSLLGVHVSVLGEVEQDLALYRSNAKPGMKLYASGTIGNGALGLMLLEKKIDPSLFGAQGDALIDCYRHPTPQIKLGMALTGCAKAAIDISDGLVLDAERMAQASNVQLRIEIDRLPLKTSVKQALLIMPDLMKVIISGGDDYQLLFAAFDDQIQSNLTLLKQTGSQFCQIGEICKKNNPGGDDVVLINRDGSHYQIIKKGYLHQFNSK
ncbi:MAG: thiamine-phosphate kinase [Pseudomonadota bacterium]